MEEDIKKDLREIKEEIKAQEKSEKKIEVEAEETTKTKETETEKLEIIPERAEGLVEKLIKPEEEKEEVLEKRAFPKLKPKEIFLISGSILTIAFTVVGIWVSLKLIKGDFGEKEKAKPLSKSEESFLESEAFKKFSKIVIWKDEKEAEYPYKLELKQFLIPVGYKEFLSLDITLYFDNSTSIEEIIKKELEFREALYTYLKTISPDTWKDAQNPNFLEKTIKEKLEEKKIKPLPQKIRLEGVILRG